MDRDGPHRNLTPREEEIVTLLARGIPNKRIAAQLTTERGDSLSVRTVEDHINTIAALLPNPDNLPARTRVMLWAVWREWKNSPKSA